MMELPAVTHVWIAAGVTDLRRGFTGLSAVVQTVLDQDPFSGHVFVFRGRRGDLIKVLWWDGDGLCLLAKRLERGRFAWPRASSGTVALTTFQDDSGRPLQLSALLPAVSSHDWTDPPQLGGDRYGTSNPCRGATSTSHGMVQRKANFAVHSKIGSTW